MKKIFTIAVVVIVIVGTGYFAFYRPQLSNNNIVGGDKDEHGCIGSAGYSWCEEKQKCLRIWEETCSAEDIKTAEELKKLLANKYNKDIDDVIVNVVMSDDTHAVGTTFFLMDGEQGEGGMVLAIKEGSSWKLVYDGNGSVDCPLLKNTYNFSNDLLAGFCN